MGVMDYHHAVQDEIFTGRRMTSTNRKGSADKSIPHTRLEEEEMIWETYEKGKKLGQGSFGKVYEVKHKSTGHVWAMKFINKDKAGGTRIKLLEREVAILKRVSHPNIIQLNEVFETGKRMYLVMELCAQGELADALKDKKYFMENEVKLMTKELAGAIAYLHKNDIVHRDLKLENILVSNYPDAADPEDRLQIKITDFGLSITKTGVGHDNMMQDFCGTPNYMAPEIIDNKSYSQQCDVWALGVIVYTLICGYPPFRAKEEEVLYDLIKKAEVDFSDEVWEEVSGDAKMCIRGMLHQDPAHRLTALEICDHKWITGKTEGNTQNVLALMREWKESLKVEEAETSAINGTPESPSTDLQATDDLHTNHSEETNNNETTTSATHDEKTTANKKPGSGGKRSSLGNTSTGNLKARLSTSPLKYPGSKSPMPNSRNTPTTQLRDPRPSTRPSNKQTTIKPSSTPRPSTKGPGDKKK